MNESPDQSDLKRLEQLASQKCNGELTEEGFVELETLLATSDELRAAYWQMNGVHTDLEWDLVGKENSRHEIVRHLSEDLLAGSAILAAVEEAPSSWPVRGWWGPAIAAGLSAVVLTGLATGYLKFRTHTQQVAESSADSNASGPAPAQLTSLMDNSRWSFGRAGDRNPEQFRYGDTVCVEEGMVEMHLEGGTVGQLRAPVVLQLISQNRIRLLSGMIRVNAPARTDGFTVETPSAEVVDLGTEFSVEAAKTGTDLVVYGGKVDLKVPQEAAGGQDAKVTSQQFTAGQAVRVNMNGTLSRIMNVKSSVNPLEPAGTASAHVISKVVDNISRNGMWAFYEIVWGGMEEDAYAFVDRVHEWNGKTAAGMPAYLLGGDYIKTFNDDKSTDDLSIDVTLSQPATLYVLFDKRLTPPQWLTDSFVDTGEEMGVDESGDTGHFFPDNELWAQIGPGRSINRTHSIWKKVVPLAGTVRLGPNGKNAPNVEAFRANMYGIVAVPLEPAEKTGI